MDVKCPKCGTVILHSAARQELEKRITQLEQQISDMGKPITPDAPNQSHPHWTHSLKRYICPTCGKPTTHYKRGDLPHRRLISAHNGQDGLLCPRSGSFIGDTQPAQETK